jgi:type I restriction enzyme S subunit
MSTHAYTDHPPLCELRMAGHLVEDPVIGLFAELAALEQRRTKTRALKQGVMQELLTGRTRLL